MRLISLFCSIGAMAGLAACTEPNPGFVGAGKDARRPADGPGAGDGRPGDGGAAVADGAGPDVVPSVCSTDAECDDHRPCTADRCDQAQQRCANTVLAGHCVIRGSCRRQGELDPQSLCRYCNPDIDALAWSARDDGTPCEDDQLGCTDDVCQAGTCAHRLTGCVVNGQCYAEGASAAGNACEECVAAKNQQSLTFVDGKPCVPAGPGQALAGVCARAACRALVEAGFDTTLVGALPGASLSGVADVPGSGIWAAVEYRLGEVAKGALLALPPTTLDSVVLTGQPVRGIHHRVAVGAWGAIFRHAAGGWKQGKQLENALGTVPRTAVWGTALANGDELYLLAGESGADGSPAGVYACTVAASGWPSCTGMGGFDGAPALGAVYGTLSAAGVAGPAWTVSTGQWEDIYYLAPNAASWTHEAPHGCYDTPGNPCHNPTSGAFADLHASGLTDAWVVGSGGLLLRYDGAWHSLAGTPAGLPAYALDAVLSMPADNVLVIAARYDAGGDQQVALFTYNFALDRWFGPIPVAKFGPGGPGRIRDIARAQNGTLWLVGDQPLKVYSKVVPMGWALRLQ